MVTWVRAWYIHCFHRACRLPPVERPFDQSLKSCHAQAFVTPEDRRRDVLSWKNKHTQTQSKHTPTKIQFHALHTLQTEHIIIPITGVSLGSHNYGRFFAGIKPYIVEVFPTWLEFLSGYSINIPTLSCVCLEELHAVQYSRKTTECGLWHDTW